MLLNLQGAVTPASSGSQLSYPFYVPNNARLIAIHFEYEPKQLADELLTESLIVESLKKYVQSDHQESMIRDWRSYAPLKNLLTLSVDAPDGYRGAAHRHDPVQRLVLSETSASPGFLPGSLLAGQWQVTVSLHAVVTEECRYRLRVQSSAERRDTDALDSM